MKPLLPVLVAILFFLTGNVCHAAEYTGCVTPQDTVIGFHANEERTDISATRCYAGNDESVYILEIGSEKYEWLDPVRTGSRVYFEVYLGARTDYLLVAFGYDSADDRDNFYDYIVYAAGHTAPLAEGGSTVRPQLVDVYPEALAEQ